MNDQPDQLHHPFTPVQSDPTSPDLAGPLGARLDPLAATPDPLDHSSNTLDTNQDPIEAAPESEALLIAQQSNTPPLFEYYTRPSQDRIPHVGHLALLALLTLSALIIVAIIGQVALMRHVFGVSSITEAAGNVRYLLGTQALLYVFTFVGSVIVFPLVWHKSLFAGIQWRGTRALQRSGYLIGAAALCFILAMIDGYFFPGPKDAPIDRIFRTPGAAWFLFAFGVTFAPFFEEIAFRGFLLPALATACDWAAEKTTHRPPPALDFNGHPHWSMPAMVIASLVTSLFFAAMHADQTSYSVGPFLLLILVSLVLCYARLRLRSLAASVLLHATYNFLLFSFMLIGTGGFRHLDKM